MSKTAWLAGAALLAILGSSAEAATIKEWSLGSVTAKASGPLYGSPTLGPGDQHGSFAVGDSFCAFASTGGVVKLISASGERAYASNAPDAFEPSTARIGVCRRPAQMTDGPQPSAAEEFRIPPPRPPATALENSWRLLPLGALLVGFAALGASIWPPRFKGQGKRGYHSVIAEDYPRIAAYERDFLTDDAGRPWRVNPDGTKVRLKGYIFDEDSGEFYPRKSLFSRDVYSIIPFKKRVLNYSTRMPGVIKAALALVFIMWPATFFCLYYAAKSSFDPFGNWVLPLLGFGFFGFMTVLTTAIVVRGNHKSSVGPAPLGFKGSDFGPESATAPSAAVDLAYNPNA